MRYNVRTLRLEYVHLEGIQTEVNALTRGVNAGVDLY